MTWASSCVAACFETPQTGFSCSWQRQCERHQSPLNRDVTGVECQVIWRVVTISSSKLVSLVSSHHFTLTENPEPSGCHVSTHPDQTNPDRTNPDWTNPDRTNSDRTNQTNPDWTNQTNSDWTNQTNSDWTNQTNPDRKTQTGKTQTGQTGSNTATSASLHMKTLVRAEH